MTDFSRIIETHAVIKVEKRLGKISVLPDAEGSSEETEAPISPEVEDASKEIEAPISPEVEDASKETEAPISPEVEDASKETEAPIPSEVEGASEETAAPTLSGMGNYSVETQKYIESEASGVKKFIDINKYPADFYDLMAVIHCLFERAGIEYWIDGGTLLGAIRHKGMIPWDDDLDIMAPCKDFDDFVHRVAPVLEKLGYKCVIMDNFFAEEYKDHPIFGQNKFVKVIIPSELCPEKSNTERLFIDIFFAVEHEENIYPFGKAFHPFPAADLRPLRNDYQFGPLKLWGPNNPNRYLEELYGEKYAEEAALGINHIRPGQQVLDYKDVTRMTLTEELYEPAKPFGPLTMYNTLLGILPQLPEELPYCEVSGLSSYDPDDCY